MDTSQTHDDSRDVYIPNQSPDAQFRQLQQELEEARAIAQNAIRDRDRMTRRADRMGFFIDSIVWSGGPGMSSTCKHCGCNYGDNHEPGCPYGAWGQGAFRPSRGIVR
jgi:hypothetical protein